MQKKMALRMLPSEAGSESLIKDRIAVHAGISDGQVSGFHILKRSVDARGRQVWINLTVNAFINEPFRQRTLRGFQFKDVNRAPKKTVIIGAGPAGLFAALQLIEKGIRPIVLERGKNVRARRRDLAILNKEGIVNAESNYCFGEGGAGTYSDGKLYTRSNKRGDINRILNLFVHFGAEENILYDAHPHIGTNKLPHIIAAMRRTIEDCGGMLLFEKKVVDFVIDRDVLKAVKTSDENLFEADAFILATGHSARDMFNLLHQKKIDIRLKPFALGVRIEHPQQLIDEIQYHFAPNIPSFRAGSFDLPPASYNLVTQANERGVFSFCMCPGGIIAPCATTPGEIVTNGWSPSKRNNPFANSGIVVAVEAEDLKPYEQYGALAGLKLQESIERKAFIAGKNDQENNFGQIAPAQRLIDFINNKTSNSLPDCSYKPGVVSAAVHQLFPKQITERLQQGFRDFGNKMKGFLIREAIVVAVESRTSSPVKIPRDKETLQHPEIKGLYPCGEGAGYAGGIVSAAIDGQKCAEQITH